MEKVFHFVQELFACAVLKLPGDFNPREVVYRQMELIRTETVERMNKLFESVVVDFVDITGDFMASQPPNAFFLSVVVHGISSDF